MPDRFNPLRIQPPPEARTNMLAGPPQPDWAGATDENIRLYNDFLARDRQRQIELGNIDPATGQFTPQGWQAQAQNIAGGFGPADVGMVGGMAGLIKNYHGSPHLFPPTPKNPLGEFNMSKIGTGEGSQVFGQGMYTAEREGTSQGYLPPPSQPTPISPEFKAALKADDYLGFETASQAIAAMRAHPDWAKRWDIADPAALKTAFDAHEVARNANRGGHMYEVNIHAEPEDFLHWNKPIGEQNPQVQDMARRVGIDPRDFDIVKGAALYRKAGDYFGPSSKDPSFDMAATTGLREAGIPGIRYLDRGSRHLEPDHPDATHNHVVFDPATMEIVRRYGIAGLIGGGAAATAAGGQDQGSQ
jgi:hypothetical protein